MDLRRKIKWLQGSQTLVIMQVDLDGAGGRRDGETLMGSRYILKLE